MPEIIIDGTGTSQAAQVDSKSRIATRATTFPEDRFQNDEGNVFSVEFSVTPTGANDYFFYLENTGEKTLALTDIRISSTVATKVNYHKVSGTPTYSGGSGTAATVVNRNLGSSKTLSATANYNVDITGLTDEGTFFFERCAVANTRYKLTTTSNILIPQGAKIAFERVEATGTIDCVVSLVVAEEFN